MAVAKPAASTASDAAAPEEKPPLVPHTHRVDLPSEAGISAEELKGYIAWRRSQIYKPRLGGQIGGSQSINAQRAETVLTELAELVTWLENGRPGPLQRLTEDDKETYRALAARGLPVPAEIEAQL